MKLITRSLLVAAVALALSSCAKDDSQPPVADVTAPSPAEAAAQSIVVNAMPFEGLEIALGGDGNQPLDLSATQKISGEFAAPQGGTLERIGVLIGNYGNISDGDTRIEVCSGETCAAGTSQTKGTPDNDFLGVQLTPGLPVTQGAALRYTIERLSGDKPLAIWMYPKGAVF